jgi:DNA helicase HerA-like ATPase
MPADNDAPVLTVREPPEQLDEELAAYGRSAGREWTPDDADGRTQFDTPQSDDGTVIAVFPQDRFERWRSQALAHIHSVEDGRTYLAQVVRGPYAAPIGLPAASPTLVVAQVESTLFTPPYHGWAALSILGEVKDGQTVVPLYRPRPNSRVRLLSPEETRAALGCDGDLRLGRAVGYPEIEVGLRSGEKHHIPRHTLVVGTTGAGKSTCLAGLIDRLRAAGFCVLVIDVEGEYAAIDRPADSAKILPALAARGLAPEGVPETFVLVPTVAEASNPAHPRVRRFCLDFANISPHIAAELLQGNEAQTDRFLAAYDAAGELVTQLVPAAEREAHREALRLWDDQESGHPGLRLAHVLDMAEAVAALAGGEETVAERYLHAEGFRNQARELLESAVPVKKRLGHVGSWRKTVSLIGGLYRSGLFDRAGTVAPDGRAISSLDYQRMVAPGRVLVFDMAGVEAPAHRNLAISDLLRGVMEAQDRLYAAAPANAKPKTAVIVEEAHEFVSAERIRQMPTLYGQLQRIARRGRKRWLGLVFATQFPQHLPGELFSLCNNRILLRLGDEPTLARLRQSVGGVPEGLWGRLKHLPTGQAIVSAQGIDPALIVALEPGRCKLRLVD